jgi:hypothetical protein
MVACEQRLVLGAIGREQLRILQCSPVGSDNQTLDV